MICDENLLYAAPSWGQPKAEFSLFWPVRDSHPYYVDRYHNNTKTDVLYDYTLYYTGVGFIRAEVVEPELGSIGLFLFRHVRYPLFESFLPIHYSCRILDRPQDISHTLSVFRYLNKRVYRRFLSASRFWIVHLYTK